MLWRITLVGARPGGRSRTSQRTHRQGASHSAGGPPPTHRDATPAAEALGSFVFRHPLGSSLSSHWLAALDRSSGQGRRGLSAVLSCTRRFLKGKPFRGRGLGLLPANHSVYCGRANAPAGCACAPPAPGLRSTLPGLLLVPSCARCCLLPRTQAGARILLEKYEAGRVPRCLAALAFRRIDPNARAT